MKTKIEGRDFLLERPKELYSKKNLNLFYWVQAHLVSIAVYLAKYRHNQTNPSQSEKGFSFPDSLTPLESKLKVVFEWRGGGDLSAIFG